MFLLYLFTIQNFPHQTFLLHTVFYASDTSGSILKKKQAKEIFEKILPTEDFLPRAPDCDEIIMETDEDNNNEEQQQQHEQQQQEETTEVRLVCCVICFIQKIF